MSTESGDFIGTVLPSETRRGTQYRIQSLLGEGATALAFLATAQGENTVGWLVIKVVRPELVMKSGVKAALLVRKEAVALGRLNEVVPPCPFVVRFVDTGVVPYEVEHSTLELPWIAVEYVHGGIEGASLEERVEYAVANTGHAFDRQRAARAIRHICEGLEEVHAAGIIHRDLTPGNVLCCGFGNEEVFKLSDFGLARPTGMNATLNAIMLGTPGYMPPEQFELGSLSAQADLFALGALTFYMLTGESYFPGDHPAHSLAQVKGSQRRSIRSCIALCPELAGDEAACAAIDDVLRRASAQNPLHRPVSARAFCEGILPHLEARDSRLFATNMRLLAAMQSSRTPHPARDRWGILCEPGADRVIRALGWDTDGHCLAATTNGLEYWGGGGWHTVSLREPALLRGIRAIVRVGPGRWIVGTGESRLVEYSRHGALRIVSGGDRQLEMDAVSGDLEDIAVVAGRRPGGEVALCAYVRGYWLKPLPVPELACILSISQLEAERWLIAGRGWDGRGVVAFYWPLRWEVESISAPANRAYLSTASRVECSTAVAGGAGGTIVQVVGGDVRTCTLPDRVDLAASAMDVLGRTWVGAAGQLWVDHPEGGWTRIWANPSWQAPFVGIHAEIGVVTAMTADGAVLESRLTRSELLATAMRHGTHEPV